MIVKTIPVSPFMTNCYLLGCPETREAILIDAGDEAERILDQVAQEGLTLKYMINTHAHLDHVSAVADIQSAAGVPFYLHQKDQIILDHLEESRSAFGLPSGDVPKVDEYIDPSKTYQFGNIQFTVIETPGHTPGGVCFLFKELLFAGDTLFSGSIGRTDLPGGNSAQLLSSIKTQLMTLDDHIQVYCGHGPTTSIGKEKLSNPFLS